MVRLADLPDYEREHLLGKNLKPIGPTPWVEPKKPLGAMRLALITTAGLHFREDTAFDFNDASFRVIPSEQSANDLVMSHSSVNFDRTGFQEDVNLVFPIDRLRELEAEGRIGSVADLHYSFMGAGLLPPSYEKSVRALAAHLREDHVDAVLLTPV